MSDWFSLFFLFLPFVIVSKSSTHENAFGCKTKEWNDYVCINADTFIQIFGTVMTGGGWIACYLNHYNDPFKVVLNAEKASNKTETQTQRWFSINA